MIAEYEVTNYIEPEEYLNENFGCGMHQWLEA